MNEVYYVLENGEKLGPFNYDELIERGLSVDTQVSTVITDTWQQASYMPEFAEYFEANGYYFPTEDNLAGFVRRTTAFIIDYFIVAFVSMFTAIKLGWVTLPPPTADLTTVMNTMTSKRSFLYLELGFALIFLLYNTLLDITDMRGSLGKRLLNLKVVDEDGYKLTFLKSLLRNLGGLSAFNMIGIFVIIGSFFASKAKQTWYEYFTKTYIIKGE